jgi:hypothetical protein
VSTGELNRMVLTAGGGEQPGAQSIRTPLRKWDLFEESLAPSKKAGHD